MMKAFYTLYLEPFGTYWYLLVKKESTEYVNETVRVRVCCSPVQEFFRLKGRRNLKIRCTTRPQAESYKVYVVSDLGFPCSIEVCTVKGRREIRTIWEQDLLLKAFPDNFHVTVYEEGRTGYKLCKRKK